MIRAFDRVASSAGRRIAEPGKTVAALPREGVLPLAAPTDFNAGSAWVTPFSSGMASPGFGVTPTMLPAWGQQTYAPAPPAAPVFSNDGWVSPYGASTVASAPAAPSLPGWSNVASATTSPVATPAVASPPDKSGSLNALDSLRSQASDALYQAQLGGTSNSGLESGLTAAQGSAAQAASAFERGRNDAEGLDVSEHGREAQRALDSVAQALDNLPSGGSALGNVAGMVSSMRQTLSSVQASDLQHPERLTALSQAIDSVERSASQGASTGSTIGDSLSGVRWKLSSARDSAGNLAADSADVDSHEVAWNGQTQAHELSSQLGDLARQAGWSGRDDISSLVSALETLRDKAGEAYSSEKYS